MVSKQRRLIFLGSIGLGLGVGFGCACPASAAVATGDGAHTHVHAAASPAAALPAAGRKWATDAPLRQAMGNIRTALDAALDDIHAGRLSVAGYAALAGTIRGEVDAMIRNCKLEPQADVQLHGVIGALLHGAETMEGKTKHATRRDGAVQTMRALEDYAARFDDPGWHASGQAGHK